MEKLDLKDRKILYHLDLNSRQSFRSIGRKVGLSKDIVASRVKRLQEQGIIINFYTVIDSFKLGYTSLRFYFVYRYTFPEVEKEIINYFVKNKYVWWVTSCKGRFDLVVIMYVKNLNDFYSFWKATLEKYRHFFQNQVFSFFLQSFLFRYSYLLNEYDKADRDKFENIGGGKRVEIDQLDFQILKILASNARIPTTEIAKKLNSTTLTIKNRIEKLIDLGVIQGFRIDIDHLKFGYQYFKADIELIEYKERKKILNYIKSNPHLVIINETAGYVDLEIELVVESLNQFYEIMQDLNIKFPNTIKNYTYFYAPKIYKMHYLPEE